MGLKDVIELSGAILVSLGGSASIILGLSNWLGKVWANRLMEKEKAEHAQELEALRSRITQDTESYKIKLKKSEFLFQKEFEAALEFIALKRSFLPNYKFPGMDWEDACDEIAHNLHKIEIALGVYLSRHGVVLKSEIKELLSHSIGIAGENGFEITTIDVPPYVNKAANDLYKNLDKIEELLLQQVHS